MSIPLTANSSRRQNIKVKSYEAELVRFFLGGGLRGGGSGHLGQGGRPGQAGSHALRLLTFSCHAGTVILQSEQSGKWQAWDDFPLLGTWTESGFIGRDGWGKEMGAHMLEAYPCGKGTRSVNMCDNCTCANVWARSPSLPQGAHILVQGSSWRATRTNKDVTWSGKRCQVCG